MNAFQAGDILSYSVDESKWEFKDYARGMITTLADNPTNKGNSGIDTSIVMVRPLKPKDNKLSNQGFRGMPAKEFKKV